MSRPAQLEKPVVPFNVDGFVGMRDQRSQKYKPGEMELIVNMLPESRDRASRLLMRPGYKRYCAAAAANALQATVSTVGPTQLIDGYFGSTYKSLLVTDAGIFSLNHSAYTITTELTLAQITAAGATLTGSRVVFFNNKLIVSSTTGKPWSWTGATGAGITVLTNYSRINASDVTVYGGRLVFVYNLANANELLWSEPGDETIGYATAPYANFWPLRQTGSNVLTFIVGTNDGLFFQRVGSGTGMVRGDNDANWATTSTRDELSSQVGASATIRTAMARPAIGGDDGVVMFFDQRSRPMLYRPGKRLVHLWEQLPRLFGETKGASWDTAPWAFELAPAELNISLILGGPIGLWYDKAWHCHCFAIDTGIANQCLIFYFDDLTDRLVSVWSTTMTGSTSSTGLLGYSIFSLGADERPAPMKIDKSGFVFWQDNFNTVNAGRSWSEEISNGAGAPVVGTVIGPPHGSNPTLDYWFDRLDLLVEARSTHTVRVGYVTSARHKGSLTPADQTFTEAGLANTPYQRHVEMGLQGDVLARWLMPQIQVEAIAGQDLQAALYGYRIEARPDGQAVGNL